MHRHAIGVTAGWLLSWSALQAAELSVSSMSMVQGTSANVVVSGKITGEATVGVTIVLGVVPQPGAVGTVEFTPAPSVDIVQLGDPWPGAGTFSAFDTDRTTSSTWNGIVDDDGEFLPEPETVSFDGAVAGFPVIASADALGVWEVSLSTPAVDSSWQSLATTLVAGTITVVEAADPPSQPAGEAGFAKNRYISLVAANPGQQTALRVTLEDLPSPFESFEGTRMWIAGPQETSENAGKVNPADAPGWPTFMASRLTCQPVYADWGSLGPIHVFDDEIVPTATYEIQAISEGCDTTDEAQYSAPLAVTTSYYWGDVTGDCGVTPCTPPDGIVDIVDVTAVYDKFRNLAGTPIKARSDVDPSLPNRLVEIIDITRTNDAAGGASYPFAGPSGCP
ncbi:MAG: hypothetical protein JSU86_17750 [Phycisphaerales bacterium]|nr:MAG: hypothetical protein JSU86_17750 [Phycisphaerales bacterium]